MGVYAYFYQNSKRINSTKRPQAQPDDFAVSIELKAPTNLYTPSITLTSDTFMVGSVLGNPIQYDYCYIPEFLRYYFIRSWAWENGIWRAELEVDVLASFKEQIGDTFTYVLRSAAAYDPNLIDTKYTTRSTARGTFNGVPQVWKTNLRSSSVSDGFFVLGIVNNDSNAVGATSYYACSGVVLRDFISQLYASPAWMNITDASISNDLQKMLINPIQYVTSCQWMPLPMSAAAQAAATMITSVPVGWWSVNLSTGNYFYKMDAANINGTFYVDFTLPMHSQAGNPQLSWLMNSPYSNYQLQFYPFGLIPLDSAKLYGCTGIRCYIEIDLITGTGVLSILRKDSNGELPGVMYADTAQVAIPFSLAQMSVDLSRISSSSSLVMSAGLALASDTEATSELVNSVENFIDTAVPGFGSLAGQWFDNAVDWAMGGFAGNAPRLLNDNYKQGTAAAGRALMSSVGKVAGNIGNAVLASSGTCKTQGVNGALAQYRLPQRVELFYFEIVEQDPVHYGYPLCSHQQIKNIPGFILCANEGNLKIQGTPVERQTIVAAMTGGFYYE